MSDTQERRRPNDRPRVNAALLWFALIVLAAPRSPGGDQAMADSRRQHHLRGCRHRDLRCVTILDFNGLRRSTPDTAVPSTQSAALPPDCDARVQPERRKRSRGAPEPRAVAQT